MSNRTPGPWGLRGYQIRAANGLGKHVATYQICEADGRLIAAAPELLKMLAKAIDTLRAHESIEAEVCADELDERLEALKLAEDE